MSAARRLAILARRLRRGARADTPPLLAFTDPDRGGASLALVAALPRGAALVFRAFGAADAPAQARALAGACRRRGVRLLIGADVQLAKAVRADGVHLPERALASGRARRRWPKQWPKTWIVTAAAHDQGALARARRAGVDAAVLSPVFASRSASAGTPLGVRRARLWAARAGLPVYALGGVTARTARRLPRGVFAGVAAVDGLVRT
ncbi:MAG: thiamine phosphate synthase [Alphaproteobacteria bacterium]|nr:thiamine phosphate synthase [Alphaproteobacteria bacterium]